MILWKIVIENNTFPSIQLLKLISDHIKYCTVHNPIGLTRVEHLVLFFFFFRGILAPYPMILLWIGQAKESQCGHKLLPDHTLPICLRTTVQILKRVALAYKSWDFCQISGPIEVGTQTMLESIRNLYQSDHSTMLQLGSKRHNTLHRYIHLRSKTCWVENALHIMQSKATKYAHV